MNTSTYYHIIAIIIFFCSLEVNAQVEGIFTFGVKGGVNHSEITGIKSMLTSHYGDSNFYSNYTAKPVNNPTAGVVLNYKIWDSRMALQSELNYSMENFRMLYDDDSGLHRDINFKYNYLQLGALVKLYTYRGLNIGLGPQFGYILNPHNIIYRSNQFQGSENPSESDLITQQDYRDNLYGRSNFQMLFNIGYEFKFGLFLDARYCHGLADVIETKSNSPNWIENENNTKNFQLTIGYLFQFD